MPASVSKEHSIQQLKLYDRYRADVIQVLDRAKAFRDWVLNVGVHHPFMETEDSHGGWMFNTSYGLCNNLHADGVVQICAASWPEFSGDSSYPVPSVPAKYGTPSVSEEYWNSRHKYVGEYGALRLSLLDHIINLLETAVGQLNDELLDELLNKE